ncbi:MAG: hypothetical protein ABID61_00040 [Candidatus Micrarchaeota archaeon]
MKQILCVFFIISLIYAVHPPWVKPGVVAIYDGYSGVKNAAGGYDTPVQVRITDTISSIDQNEILVTITFQEISSGTMLPTQIQKVKISDSIGAFWADPKELAKLKQGDKVGPFTVTGVGPLEVNGKQWNVVMINYEEDDVRLTYVFDIPTGLLVSLTEIHGKQEVYGYFSSINTDINAGYIAPDPIVGNNNIQQNNTQQFGANQTEESLPKQIGKICGSSFSFILLLVYIYFRG